MRALFPAVFRFGWDWEGVFYSLAISDVCIAYSRLSELFGACNTFVCLGGLAGREQVKVALVWGSRMVEQTYRETTVSSPTHFHPLLPWEVILSARSERRHWEWCCWVQGRLSCSQYPTPPHGENRRGGYVKVAEASELIQVSGE